MSAASPYVGPNPLTRKNQLFGRDETVRLLKWMLLSDRIILLHAPSGAGKSSLIAAKGGLLSELEKMAFTPLPTIRFDARTNREGCSRYEGDALDSLGAPREVSSLKDWVDELERARDTASADAPTVLVFDQVEELITFDAADQSGKRTFLEDRLAPVLAASHRYAVFAIRDDYLGAFEPYTALLPTGLARRYRLDLLSVDNARKAILGPVASSQVTWTAPALQQVLDALARRTVRDLDGTEHVERTDAIEPLHLQVVCQARWETVSWTDGRASVIDALPDAMAGGVDRALGNWYGDVVRKVSQRSREAGNGEVPEPKGPAAQGAQRPQVPERVIRDWIEARLITSQGLRRQIEVGASSAEGMPIGIVHELERLRLVHREKRQNSWWCELAHDRLCPLVRSHNAAWAASHLTLLQRRAREWARAQYSDLALLSPEELKDCEQRGETQDLTEDEQRFLDASRDHVDAASEALRLDRKRKRWRIIAQFSVVSIVLAALGVWWLVRLNNELRVQTTAANAATQEAERERERVQELFSFGVARQLAETEPAYAASLLLALDWEKVPGALQLASELAGRPLPRAILSETGEQASRVAISADGSVAVTIDSQEIARVWSAVTGALIQKKILEGEVTNLDMDDAGARIVMSIPPPASADERADRVVIWSPKVNASPRLPPHDEVGDVFRLVLSPDGRWLVVTWNLSCNTYVYDLQPAEPALLTRRDGIRTDPAHCRGARVAFDPTGSRMAVGHRSSAGTTVDLFDLTQTGAPPALVPLRLERGAGGRSRQIVFSADGETMAAAGHGAIEVWGPDGVLRASRAGLSDEATEASIAVSPDGQHLLVEFSGQAAPRLFRAADLEEIPLGLSETTGEPRLRLDGDRWATALHFDEEKAVWQVCRATWAFGRTAAPTCIDGSARVSPSLDAEGSRLVAINPRGDAMVVDLNRSPEPVVAQGYWPAPFRSGVDQLALIGRASWDSWSTGGATTLTRPVGLGDDPGLIGACEIVGSNGEDLLIGVDRGEKLRGWRETGGRLGGDAWPGLGDLATHLTCHPSGRAAFAVTPAGVVLLGPSGSRRFNGAEAASIFSSAHHAGIVQPNGVLQVVRTSDMREVIRVQDAMGLIEDVRRSDQTGSWRALRLEPNGESTWMGIVPDMLVSTVLPHGSPQVEEESGEIGGDPTLAGKPDRSFCLQVASRGDKVLHALARCELIEIWSGSLDAPPIRIYTPQELRAVAVSPDDSALAGLTGGGAVLVWSLRAPTRAPLMLSATSVWPPGHAIGVGAVTPMVAFTPDGGRIIASDGAGNVVAWLFDRAQLGAVLGRASPACLPMQRYKELFADLATSGDALEKASLAAWRSCTEAR